MATCDAEALMEQADCLCGLSDRDIQIAHLQLLCNILSELEEDDATLWDDLRIPIDTTKLGGSKDPNYIKFLDDGAGSQGVFAYAFDKTTEEETYFSAQLPHGWVEGTDLRFHIHWSPSGTDTTGDVVWGLEYSWSNINGTFSNTTISGIADTPDGVAKKHQMTSAIVIDASGKTASSMIMCRLFRDTTNSTGAGTDAYNEDAFLLEADFHYQVAGAGGEIPFI